MKHLEVVFLAVPVVIYPFLFAIIYEMRLIRRRGRDLPLFPAPSDSLSRRLNPDLDTKPVSRVRRGAR